MEPQATWPEIGLSSVWQQPNFNASSLEILKFLLELRKLIKHYGTGKAVIENYRRLSQFLAKIVKGTLPLVELPKVLLKAAKKF